MSVVTNGTSGKSTSTTSERTLPVRGKAGRLASRIALRARGRRAVACAGCVVGRQYPSSSRAMARPSESTVTWAYSSPSSRSVTVEPSGFTTVREPGWAGTADAVPAAMII